ncbi:transmembrane protein [Ditylenchus destructor]|nr:transmembrane protein [Ditylenchus destructor]
MQWTQHSSPAYDCIASNCDPNYGIFASGDRISRLVVRNLRRISTLTALPRVQLQTLTTRWLLWWSFTVVVNSYRAPTLSAAHIWSLLSNLLVVVLSLGLWKKTNTYLEQPIIDFTRKCTFVLRDNSLDPERYLFWTSSEEFNQFGEYAGAAALDTDRLLVPTIETQELDHNDDGRPDELLIGVSLRLPSASSQHLDVYSIFYALEVKVKLEYRALVQIDGWIIGATEHLMPGQALNVWGDLHVVQKQPLPSYGLLSTNSTNVTKNDGIMSQYDIGLSEYFPMEIRRRNFEKNFSVDLLGKTENWLPSFHQQNNASGDPWQFSANFRIFIREQNLTYRTNAFELLKWAWIQYFAIFIIVKFIFNSLSSFLYENQILGTIVECERKIKTR